MFRFVSQWPVITEPQLRTQNISSGICGGKIIKETGFSPSALNSFTPLPSAIRNHSNKSSLCNTLKNNARRKMDLRVHSVGKHEIK